jgi:hypothetical protein
MSPAQRPVQGSEIEPWRVSVANASTKNLNRRRSLVWLYAGVLPGGSLKTLEFPPNYL